MVFQMEESLREAVAYADRNNIDYIHINEAKEILGLDEEIVLGG